MGNDQKSGKPSVIDELVNSLEDVLEERKTKIDRRKSIDPKNTYVQPDKDRRTGKDRRDEPKK